MTVVVYDAVEDEHSDFRVKVLNSSVPVKAPTFTISGGSYWRNNGQTDFGMRFLFRLFLSLKPSLVKKLKLSLYFRNKL